MGFFGAMHDWTVRDTSSYWILDSVYVHTRVFCVSVSVSESVKYAPDTTDTRKQIPSPAINLCIV